MTIEMPAGALSLQATRTLASEPADRPSLLEKAREPLVGASAPVAREPVAYRLSGDRPGWRPVRVAASQGKTTIEFPRPLAHDEAPALVLLDVVDTEFVRYRATGRTLEVEGVLGRAVLVHGLGRERQTVHLTPVAGADAAVRTFAAAEGGGGE